MPVRRLCSYPGCSRFAEEGSTRCDKHPLPKREFPDSGWLTEDQKKFYRTSRWRTLRDRIIREHPYCSRCGSTQRLQVHHSGHDYFNEEDFFRGPFEVICDSCHSKESIRRGFARKKRNDSEI